MNVLITGASGGLGRVVTKTFLENGWTVYGVIHKDSDRDLLKQYVVKHLSNLHILSADVTDSSQLEQILNGITHLDAAVHLVGGYTGGKSIVDTPESDFEAMWTLNVKSTFLVAKASYPLLQKANGGAFIAIGAKFVLHPSPKTSAYATAKAAVAHLIQILAEEGRPHGIRANCILPSVIRTPANESWGTPEEMAKWITPEEIANAILFLCSPAGAGISGALIPMFGKISL